MYFQKCFNTRKDAITCVRLCQGSKETNLTYVGSYKKQIQLMGKSEEGKECCCPEGNVQGKSLINEAM